MVMYRQAQFAHGTTRLDLNTAPYQLVAGSWASAGQQLEAQIIIQGTALAEIERYAATLRRWLQQARLYAEKRQGIPVYLYTKTCDALETTAELGATWLRKQVLSGSLIMPDVSASAEGRYSAICTLSLEMDDTWRRDTPASLLAASGTVTQRNDGGVTVAAGGSLTAQRLTWTATAGLTVRVRWLYSDNDCVFFFAETGTSDTRALYLASDNKLYMYDAGLDHAVSTALTAMAGEELEIVFKWDCITAKMSIWVNGVANGSTGNIAVSLTFPDTYQVFAPSAVSQHLLSYQLWPVPLTDAECAGLYAWGRPEAELAYYVAPADHKNTNAYYELYNLPGAADARLRLQLSDATQAYDQIKLGARPMRLPAALKWECEAGTLGTATASAADATASGGNVARYTPTTANNWATRTTIVLAADPDDVAALYGQHRLYLAGKDSAATVGVNTIKWRVSFAGQAGAWSDACQFAAVGTYSLTDCGILDIPAGIWPDEMETCTTDVQAGSYVTLEIESANSIGSGGGTLDMDAVYLAPAEIEGTATCTALTTAQYLVLDWAAQPPYAAVVAECRSLEFAAWADWVGDDLILPPGDAALWLYAFRDSSEAAQANDTLTVWPFVLPTWGG